LERLNHTKIGIRLERALEWADKPLAKRGSIVESMRNKSHNGQCDIHSKGCDGTLHDTECKNLRRFDRPTRLKWFQKNLLNKNFRQGARRTLIFSNLFTRRTTLDLLQDFFSTIYIIDRQIENRAAARVLSRLLRPLRRLEHAKGRLESVTIHLSKKIDALHAGADELASSYTDPPFLFQNSTLSPSIADLAELDFQEKIDSRLSLKR